MTDTVPVGRNAFVEPIDKPMPAGHFIQQPKRPKPPDIAPKQGMGIGAAQDPASMLKNLFGAGGDDDDDDEPAEKPKLANRK